MSQLESEPASDRCEIIASRTKTHLIFFEHFALAQCLHRVDLAGVGLLYDSDLDDAGTVDEKGRMARVIICLS